MNATMLQSSSIDRYAETFAQNFTIVLLGIIINCINGIFVVTFFRSSVFYNDPRYILYIHLVLNDMLMVFVTVVLFVMAYAWSNVPVPFCIILLMTASTTHKNTPLTLAGMAIERYIAICKPLHHTNICTVPRTYILISLIWGVGVLPALADLIVFCVVQPISFSATTRCSSAKLFHTTYHEEMNALLNGMYSSAVWLILVLTYCRVLMAARRATCEKSSVKKAQNTILLHGVQLLLCMLSYITPVIDRMYTPLIPAQRGKVLFFNYLITNIMPRLLSPLIYGIRDKHFWKHTKGLFALCVVRVEAKTPSS